MYIISLFLSVILYLCGLGDTKLERQAGEDFFDYVVRIKELPLQQQERAHCLQFLEHPENVHTPYLDTLRSLYKEQLSLRMGDSIKECKAEFVEQKVHRLMKSFLKEKMGMHKTVIPNHDLAKRAKWDPHYHGSSLFADHFPKATLYLPNFEEAYVYIRNEHRKLADRRIFILEAMEEDSFADITETCSSYDSWHFTHSGRKMIPILCHKRESGAVQRHDVLGYDMCGLELEDSYVSQKEFLESLEGSKVVRMHMGETIIPDHGKEHVRLLLDEVEKYYGSSKPLRIGHGTHISIDDMVRVAKKGYYIEACLSSNKRTAVLDKRSDYPLGVMLLLGVNVVIGTDGGRLYSTTLAEEYTHATRNLQKFHDKLGVSQDFVMLPNGDCLQYKHILSLLKAGKEKEVRLEEGVTYSALKENVDPEVLARISAETLVKNATTLLEACYNPL